VEDYARFAIKVPYMPNHGGYIYCRWGDPNAPGTDDPLSVFEDYVVDYVKIVCDEAYGDDEHIPDLVVDGVLADVDTDEVVKTDEGYRSLGSAAGIVFPFSSWYHIGVWDFTLVAITKPGLISMMNVYLFKQGDVGPRFYMGIINSTGNLLVYMDVDGDKREVRVERDFFDGKEHCFIASFTRENRLRVYVDGEFAGDVAISTYKDTDLGVAAPMIMLSGACTFKRSYLFFRDMQDPVKQRLLCEKFVYPIRDYSATDKWDLYTYSYRDPWKPKLELEEEMQTRFLFGDGVMPAGADWESEIWNISITSPTFAANKVVVVGMESGDAAPTEPMTITVWGGIQSNRLTPLETITGPTAANTKVGARVELNRAIKYVKVTAHGASDQDTTAFAEGAIA